MVSVFVENFKLLKMADRGACSRCLVHGYVDLMIRTPAIWIFSVSAR